VNPSVLDLKMGTQTYDENAKPEKIAAEISKYPPQKDLGFRFTGMKVSHHFCLICFGYPIWFFP
jgi:hypothetical protein